MTEVPTNFNKILVANRGEIAVRVIRACRELGLDTVAVYSDVDREALHVRYADEAYHIGAPPPSESYLCIDKLLDVAKRAGVEAIHPGYGFLSERADFAQACIDAGIAFIGPRPDAIRAMGDKLRAREIAKSVGMPVIPGTEPGGGNGKLIEAAKKIGYPLMVKAAAGGGGKGMRAVRRAEDLPAALGIAHREALNAFGDGTIYLEKIIEGARHIEIQILADTHGSVIHLGERECSLQRRHQKLVEESPSMFVDDDLRRRMTEAAIAVAKMVDYVNAGTIECLVDKQKNFYFLEMNTRIQVEHPVTEWVTGVDIVKDQIRIARGRRMSHTQNDITMKGWAIECRINAEDPFNHFLPSAGAITSYFTPSGPGVRVDHGVYAGYKVTPYYDSLLAKLICYGDTRPAALLRMRRALEEYRIMGLQTNIPFHQNLLDSIRFMSGSFDTTFVEERFAIEQDQNELEPGIAAILATIVAHRDHQEAQIAQQMNRDPHSNWKWSYRERGHGMLL
ncbi:MAG: acetyl-CoA carboxylase biotin carboxylase subunit [Anaerolineae bacterium]|nr:acetyl-CoA carboxylase biotin carboxylase subunit [Anaerolineae bacterium]